MRRSIPVPAHSAPLAIMAAVTQKQQSEIANWKIWNLVTKLQGGGMEERGQGECRVEGEREESD